MAGWYVNSFIVKPNELVREQPYITNNIEQTRTAFALDRIARLMKDDRDKNFIAKNSSGVTVNRWTSTGMLAASASSSETAYVTWKVARSLGMVVFDNQARV